MEWWLILLIVFGGFFIIMLTGLPLAFSFLFVTSIVMYVLAGSFGLEQLVLGIYDALAKFNLTPIPFFMIMGEVFYRSGLVGRTLDTISLWVKKIPGRLGIITLLGGGLFAALSGSTVANTAMFGSIMTPEMMKRGYAKEMITGPIMASGALAMVIPPSALAVLLGSIAEVSVGRILIGAILPGILLMVLYILYIVLRCLLNPALAPAPPEDEQKIPLGGKILAALRDIVPLLFIFLLVMGLIFFGIGTPTEAAALGAVGAFVVAAIYKSLSWKMTKDALMGALRVSAMMLMIIGGSAGFSQVLAITGASREAVQIVLGLPLPPLGIMVLMLLIVTLLGLFMEQASIMMITLPLFMPLVRALEINELLFCILVLICLQVGQLTPPVGLALFTMKAVSPPEITMADIYKSAIPYVAIDIIVIFLLIIFPFIVTWLPSISM